MENDLRSEIEQLQRMPLSELRWRYQEVFGEPSLSRHKQQLIRRIAWRLQMLAHGDLSERARQRALAIANDADLRVRVPAGWNVGQPPIPQRQPGMRDPRLPAIGTVLRRHFSGKTILVTVLADGFEYQGRRYRSLSAIAREATGTQWNGLLFFGLTERGKRSQDGTR